MTSHSAQTDKPTLLQYCRLQLRQLFLLSAYPHPDSYTYPSRQRMLIVSAGLGLGNLLYGFYAFYYFYQGSNGYWFNALIALFCFVFFIKVYLRSWLRLNDSLLYALMLCWALPIFFFINYFVAGGGSPALEHLCLALLLYTNLLHWRVAAFGVPSAFGLALFARLLFSPVASATPAIDALFIGGSVLIGLVNSYSFSALEQERSRRAQRILRVIGQQLQKPLGIQLALSEALRYEAVAASESKIKNRIFELAEKLDARANQTRIALETLNQQSQNLQQFGATQILHLRALGEHIRLELNKSYGWDLQAATAPVSVECADDVFIQGELTEVVQTLASVIALILRPQLDQAKGNPESDNSQQPILHISAKNHKHHSHLEYKLVGGEPSPVETQSSPKRVRTVPRTDSETQILSSAYWLNSLNRANHKAVGDLLPAYSLFVLNKLEARIRLERIENGSPKHIHILFPLPHQYKDRNKDLPASLLDMYQ